MNGIHRTQFDHARLDLLSLVIWSRVFWRISHLKQYAKQTSSHRWSKRVLTFDRCRPHSVTFGYILLAIFINYLVACNPLEIHLVGKSSIIVHRTASILYTCKHCFERLNSISLIYKKIRKLCFKTLVVSFFLLWLKTSTLKNFQVF